MKFEEDEYSPAELHKRKKQPFERCFSLYLGPCMRMLRKDSSISAFVGLCSLTCFNDATIRKLTITSKSHELTFPRCTRLHVSIWFGYFQAPKNVAIFSAIHIKNPMSTKESAKRHTVTSSIHLVCNPCLPKDNDDKPR